MALYQVSTGAGIVAADLNQVVQTLTAAVNNPVSLAGTLAVTGATTLTGGVAGVMAATGNVTANGNRCVEGTAAITHAEVYPAQGSTASVASLSYVSVTLTFARSYASKPAGSGGAATSAGNKGSLGFSYAISTTAITGYYQNLDSNPQTISDTSIMALGA